MPLPPQNLAAQRLARHIDDNRLYGKAGYKSLDFRCRQMYRDIGPIDGMNMLDIGGGSGFFSAWAIANGAAKVTNLEPELDGSAAGMLNRFRTLQRLLPAWKERLIGREKTLQGYDLGDGPFDLILSQSSINHLDEECCINLRRSESARETYLGLLSRIRDSLKPGGWFVVSDASSTNHWNRLGLTPPFAKSIEWHKHQEPEVWSDLLQQVGFEPVNVRWHLYYPLRHLGPLTANRMFARFTSSKFVATFRKPAKSRSVWQARRAAA